MGEQGRKLPEHVTPEESSIESLSGLPVEQQIERDIAERRAREAEGEDSDRERIEELRDRIVRSDERESSVETTTLTAPERVAAYVERYLPENLKHSSVLPRVYSGIMRGVVGLYEQFGWVKVEGREHIPSEGACLLVANHSRLFDEVRMSGIVGRTTHLIVSDLLFNLTPLHRPVLNRLGAIEVHPSLSNLTEEQKQQVLDRADAGAKEYYQKVIERDRNPQALTSEHRLFLQTVVAALAKGDAVTLFPEGLWLYEGNVLREAYRGTESIVREYRRVTGIDLPIVPIGISDKTIKVGKPMTLERSQNVHDVMKRIAALLPEEERGYYKD